MKAEGLHSATCFLPVASFNVLANDPGAPTTNEK